MPCYNVCKLCLIGLYFQNIFLNCGLKLLSSLVFKAEYQNDCHQILNVNTCETKKRKQIVQEIFRKN